MSKYVSYIRVSTKTQGTSGLGLESQRDIIKHYYPNIEREFLEVESAKNITDRPVLNEAIRYCLDKSATLVVAKIDRLSRDVRDGLALLDKLPGKIKFCDLPGEADRFIITLYFALAEKERELIGIRTRGALERKRQRGEPLGIHTHKPENKNCLIGKRHFAGVASKEKSDNSHENIRAFTVAVDKKEKGWSLHKIALHLNENKYQTRKQTDWTDVSVCRLLQRYATSDKP